MKSLILLIGLIIAMMLSACEASFIIDEMTYYSRKIGIVDDFNITRWHNIAFARESQFTFAALVDDDIAQKGLINSTEKAFQGYFAATFSSLSRSQSQALKDAQRNSSHFLIVASLTQAERHKNFDGSVANSYINAEILMSIIDVNSGLVVDKISLLADQGLMSFSGRRMENLVYEPMLVVAKELAGVN